MRNFLYICIVLLAIAGCKSKIPADIIQPDKIEAVLYDIHIVDGYITTIPLQDSAKRTAAAFYKGIYKKFGIDSAGYTKSMNFYYDHPSMLNSMYDKVKARLKKSKDSLDKIEVKRVAKLVLAAKKLKEAAIKKLKKDSLDKAALKKAGKIIPVKKLKKDSLNKADRLKKIAAAAAAKKVKLK